MQHWLFNFIFFFFSIIIWQCCSISTCWLEIIDIEKLEIYLKKIKQDFSEKQRKNFVTSLSILMTKKICLLLSFYLFAFLYSINQQKNCKPDILDQKCLNFSFLAVLFFQYTLINLCVRLVWVFYSTVDACACLNTVIKRAKMNSECLSTCRKSTWSTDSTESYFRLLQVLGALLVFAKTCACLGKPNCTQKKLNFYFLFLSHAYMHEKYQNDLFSSAEIYWQYWEPFLSKVIFIIT